MFTGKDDAQSGHYAQPEDLRVGMYVHIDLPWFRHPFTRNSFRIASDEQVRELRALRVERFRYDPARSDAAAPAERSAFAAADDASYALDIAAPAAPIFAAVAPQSAAAAEDPDPRAAQLRAYREAAQRTEKSFLKAVGIVRRLEKNLPTQPGPVLEEMGVLLAQMVDAFLVRPEVSLQVMGRNCGGEEAYLHNLNVSILCLMLAKGLALDREAAGVLGMGALLHDIGLAEIPDRVLKNSPEEQTRAERELRARHVEYGAIAGRQLGLPARALEIIAQHHELADGSGYPRGLKLEQIAPLARIVALVNCYDNICNPVDFAQALTPHEALSQIFARRKSKFDAHVLQLLIRCLGVYPPGSAVTLSDGGTGMVVSVNPQAALRPWVMLYDPAVPRERALTLNLETETGLNISKAVRPAHLPVAVRAYLSPRNRITYFFDAGPAEPAGPA